LLAIEFNFLLIRILAMPECLSLDSQCISPGKPTMRTESLNVGFINPDDFIQAKVEESAR
jgi:hypothetical protein